MSKIDIRLGVLDFRIIRDPLDKALEALTNLTDREWPKRFENIDGARAFFLTTIKVAVVTFRSIRFLAADAPKQCTPELEYALSIPPLTRSLLDQLFTVIFVFEDLPRRTRWFYKAGWREIKETFDRYKAKYANDPAWSKWLENLEKFLEEIRPKWGVSSREAANPKKIDWWPIPSKMKKQSRDRSFLEYLENWFYKALSQEAHLSFPGLSHRGAPLLMMRGKARNRVLERHKSQIVLTSITIMLAIASEMEYQLQFGLAQRFVFVWQVLIEHWEEAKELYQMRYRQFLVGDKEHVAC